MLNVTKYCDKQKKYSGSYYTIVARCIKTCDEFPCKRFSQNEVKKIDDCEEIQEIPIKLIGRRVRMYFFKTKNGFELAYKDFDPSNPDWNKMSGVEEVYYISKVYVPQMKLVVKKPDAEPKPAAKGKAKK